MYISVDFQSHKDPEVLKPLLACAPGFWKTSLLKSISGYNCTGRTYAYGISSSHDSSILSVRAVSFRKWQKRSWPDWKVLLTLFRDKGPCRVF